MILFVMTGATVPFNELIDAFDEHTLGQLAQTGFTKIVFQYGHASQAFTELLARASPSIAISGFDFTMDLAPHIDEASLVVCPAGAGSILDVLRRPRPPKLVVCVNANLMNNHQTEIAEELHPHHLIMCQPPTVAQAVSQAAGREFRPLPKPHSLQSVVDSVL